MIDFNDDDLYLADLITVAEDAVRNDLNIDCLGMLENCEGQLPASILQAMLLLIGTMYANRESVTYGTPHSVPHSYDYLIDLNRRYTRNGE